MRFGGTGRGISASVSLESRVLRMTPVACSSIHAHLVLVGTLRDGQMKHLALNTLAVLFDGVNQGDIGDGNGLFHYDDCARLSTRHFCRHVAFHLQGQ